MTDPHVLAGRLSQIADRLEDDGTFGGILAARDLREAAALIDTPDGTFVEQRRRTGDAIAQILERGTL